MHYKSFNEANEKWEKRKQRVDYNNIFLIFTFMGDQDDEKYYMRAKNLPFFNKVIFVKNQIDTDQYTSFFKISGFENKERIGVLGMYKNLFGQKYYDQFDFVDWINSAKTN